ncbi:MAG: GFA family protein [Tateyamaria sp.]|uniref:GFA family protein n=1 Tax=Tateyamaria sp. TaxID=1929288 RepID=UPI0032A0E9C6
MSHTGSCMCGAVTFTTTTPPTQANLCHCSMCRKWSGGVFMGMVVRPDELVLNGEEHLTIYTSSPWAERAFCSTCGSSVFYRVTAEGPMQGQYHIGMGSLDNADGIEIEAEYFIDLKPKAYSFAESGRQVYTEAQVMELFSGAG